MWVRFQVACCCLRHPLRTLYHAMQSSRATPTPSTTYSGRQLTQADINEYRQIFEAARQSRPISPLLPPSPPSSSAPETETSPDSLSSYLKRKNDDSMSVDISMSPNKRQRLGEYQVPIRGKRKPQLPHQEISHIHTKRATDLKHAGDADSQVMKSSKGAQLYAQSILNYAFGFFFNRPPAWKSLSRVLHVTIERFNSLASKEPSPKLDVFLSYLHFLQYAMEIQIDREYISRIRTEFDNQLRYAPNQHLQSPVPQSSNPTSNPTPESTRPTNSSDTNTPIIRATSASDGLALADLRRTPESRFTLNWDDTRRLRDILARSRGSSHNQNIRRRNINHLTPASIRAHFPRTFMRAFGEYGVGHAPLASSSDQERTGPLDLWEDNAISDLEANEEEGGDFPYPHQPEDILWVIILGRALLAELD